MKKLLIVESPAKTKTISKYLGKDFTVLSTKGHVMDLPDKETGVAVTDNGIELTYTVLEGKDAVLNTLKKAAQTSDEIYLAPDPDREGEIIAWHVAQELKAVAKKPQNIHRITFNEITKPAIETALEHPGVINEDRVRAQQARRVLDRWVGYEVSPILWRKLSKGLSAGRVQSVALKLICTREDAIRSFTPEEYWSIHALFTHPDGTLQAELALIGKKKPTVSSEKDAQALCAAIKSGSFAITQIKDSTRKKQAPAPFMTSTLQQAAYNALGLSVDATMHIAQSLYEGIPLADGSPVALITYMRTDSLRIADSALKMARSYIKKTYGEAYLPDKAHLFAKKSGQDAHEAIRPIDVAITPADIKPYVDARTFKLYQLIYNRFVAGQMKPAEYAQRSITMSDGTHTFRASGSTLTFDGFLRVYNIKEDDEEAEGTLPPSLNEKTPIQLKSVEGKQHFTQAPPRYTQATLVKDLEKEGIGRPSTYATILKTIQARAYTTLDEKKRFVPTELGMAVTKMLDENLPIIMDVRFTEKMEEALDKIAQGSLSRDELLRAFYSDFSEWVKKFAGNTNARPSEPTGLKCSAKIDGKKCGGELVIKFGKSGPFIGCSNYPECTFTSNFTRAEDGTITLVERQGPVMLDELCPNCGKQLQERIGRYGKFTACSGYPECKYIKQELSSFDCPGCGKAKLSKRSWKGSIFWGCTRYPDCKFSIPGDIIERPCPQCKRPYLITKTDKHGTTILSCHDKQCGYVLKQDPESA